MKLNRVIAAIAVALACVTSAQAAWKGTGEAGVVLSRGNSESDTANVKIAMSTEADKWKHGFEIAALRATTSGTTSADRYGAFWQSDYKFSPRTYAFGNLRYEKDKFSGFSYQRSLTFGAGYEFVDTDKVKFSGQAGAGYRQLKNAVTGQTASDAVFTIGSNYENKLTETTRLVDKFRVESGSENTLVSNFLGVEVKMSTALALAAGVDVRNNSKPPANRKKTDTLMTLNIVYAF